jgi:hypothetical protein
MFNMAEAPRPIVRPWMWLLVVMLLCAAIVAVGLPERATAAAASGTFTLGPAPDQPAAASGYFALALEAGQSSTQTVVVRNDGQKPITVELAPIDTSTTSTGGVAYLLSGKPLMKTGAWIRLGESSVELAAGEQRPVDVVVTVPGDAQPGDYVAGVSAMIPIRTPAPAASSSGNKASVQVNVQTRRVIAVQVTVPGDAAPKLEITGVKPVPGPTGMDLAIAISNQGGKFTTGSGTIDVPSTSFVRGLSIGLFVPRTSIEYPVTEWQTAPKAGEYPAHVLIHYGDGGTLTAEWNGNVTVADASLKGLKDQYVPPAGVGETKTPWLVYGLIGGLVLVVLIMGFALLRRRRPEAR